MASTYATPADLAPRIGVTTDAATGDPAVASALATAARTIDGQCNRTFGISESETRYFTPEASSSLEIDDLVSLTALVTDGDGDRTYETTWSATDYDLEPYNAQAQGRPYTKLMIAPAGRYGFPTIRKGVKLTGLWGWPSVPDAIVEATLILAARIYKRKDAPFGIAGSNELGMVTMMPKFDPDVQAAIAPYRKIWIGAV